MTYSDDEVRAAIDKHGSNRAAALALGTSEASIRRRLKAIAMRGWDQGNGVTKQVPEGYRVKGTSTLYDADGKVVMSWQKSQIDPEQVRAIVAEVVAGLIEEAPRVKTIRPPKLTAQGLLNAYIVTDLHFGMLAWGEETNDRDYDLELAESTLIGWFEQAIEASPDAEVGVLAQLGDLLHQDSWEPVTPTSRHLLDSDSRFPKLVAVVGRTFKRIICMLLEKHERVHVLMCEGNHDMSSSVWLKALMQAMFADNPRVTVEMRPDPYYCVEHGNTAVMFHHGHRKGIKGLPETLAAKFRDVFGRTKHCYAHTGHLHHIDVKENSLMVVEQHRTLAAPDAYASRGGWLSGSDAQVITYCAKYGERSRVRISAQQVLDELAEAA